MHINLKNSLSILTLNSTMSTAGDPTGLLTPILGNYLDRTSETFAIAQVKGSANDVHKHVIYNFVKRN